MASHSPCFLGVAFLPAFQGKSRTYSVDLLAEFLLSRVRAQIAIRFI